MKRLRMFLFVQYLLIISKLNGTQCNSENLIIEELINYPCIYTCNANKICNKDMWVDNISHFTASKDSLKYALRRC